MINLNVSTTIDCPVKQVFDFVSVPENASQWQNGTLAAARLPDGVSKLGSFFRSIGHLQGQRLQGVFEVIEYEPNSKYTFQSLSGPLYLRTSYTFDVIGGSTKIRVSTQATPDNTFQLNEVLMERNMKQQLQENLVLLKQLLERKHILQGAAAVS